MDNRKTRGLLLINSLLSFLVEVAMLMAFCIGGLRLGNTRWVQLIAAVGMPGVVILFWGAYMAPRSKHRIPWPWRQLIMLMLCWLGSALLWMTGSPCWAGALALVALVNVSLLLVFRS